MLFFVARSPAVQPPLAPFASALRRTLGSLRTAKTPPVSALARPPSTSTAPRANPRDGFQRTAKSSAASQLCLPAQPCPALPIARPSPATQVAPWPRPPPTARIPQTPYIHPFSRCPRLPLLPKFRTTRQEHPSWEANPSTAATNPTRRINQPTPRRRASTPSLAATTTARASPPPSRRPFVAPPGCIGPTRGGHGPSC